MFRHTIHDVTNQLHVTPVHHKLWVCILKNSTTSETTVGKSMPYRKLYVMGMMVTVNIYQNLSCLVFHKTQKICSKIIYNMYVDFTKCDIKLCITIKLIDAKQEILNLDPWLQQMWAYLCRNHSPHPTCTHSGNKTKYAFVKTGYK